MEIIKPGTIIKNTILLLNRISGSNFNENEPETIRLLSGLIKDGFSEKDFETVILKKQKQWTGTKYIQYLRPSTLFGSKFQTYLNEPDPENRIQQLASAVTKAKSANWRLDKNKR